MGSPVPVPGVSMAPSIALRLGLSPKCKSAGLGRAGVFGADQFRAPSVITLPEDVRAFYSDSPSHEKSRSSNGGWLFHQLLGECLGLVNGERWKGLRAAFAPAFGHAIVGSEFNRVDGQASRYIDDMPSQAFATVRDDNSLTANVAEAVSAFPFFCTAEHLYGPLSPDEKSKLWSIGQMNLELMGHVLGGGSTRFSFATYVNHDLDRRLARFQSEWTQFNSHVHQTRKHSAAPPPFVSTWNSVESGELMKEEVCAIRWDTPGGQTAARASQN